MHCRPECGACCIAPSITSDLPRLKGGKPGGMPCPSLDERWACRDYGLRPQVCRDFHAQPEYCGSCREEAMAILGGMEEATRPLC